MNAVIHIAVCCRGLRLLLPVLVLMVAGICHTDAHASEEAALRAMRSTGNVALMRHADAPGAFGDPAGFKLEDCATQRNLSPRGRAEAAAIGARLQSEKVVFASILSSPWCRCLDTARLMAMGPVGVSRAFSNIVVLRDEREAILAAGRTVIDAWKGPGILLIVTHGANIGGMTGVNPGSGEIVVVTPQPGSAPKIMGRLPAPAQ